ncbi:MAG TPA: calcium/sodium antiporter [Methanoregula sp.]|nr:calcium/sodium antiporter [Methanoregula sp.]
MVMFFSGLILLVKGADFLLRGAESLAVRMGVSQTTIGLTVVAFGTSLPELVVSTEAFWLKDYAIGTGNVIGSNIVNIGLILALGYIFLPASGSAAESHSSLPGNTLFTLGAALVFALLSLRGFFDGLSGIVFLVIFFGMLFLMWRSREEPDPPSDSHTRYPVILTVAGLVMVFAGAHLLLSGSVEIAEFFAVPLAVIGLTLVAVGTALPELATSSVAIIKKNHRVAVGNILGSNIFNLLFIIGVNSLFFTIPAANYGDTLVMIGFTLAIFPFFIRNNRVKQVWGGLLLCAYLLYVLLLYGIV